MVVSEPAESHPDPGKLASFVHGNLEKQQAKEVIKHLLRGCPECAEMVAPEAELLLAHPPRRPVGDGNEYEPTIERVFDQARRHWHSLMTGQATSSLNSNTSSGLPSGASI